MPTWSGTLIVQCGWYHGYLDRPSYTLLYDWDFFMEGILMTDLAPKYNPNEVEKGRYQTWLDEDLFMKCAECIQLRP